MDEMARRRTDMAHGYGGDAGDDAMDDRETWLCRSTLGAGSDLDDDDDNGDEEIEEEDEDDADADVQGDHVGAGGKQCKPRWYPPTRMTTNMGPDKAAPLFSGARSSSCGAPTTAATAAACTDPTTAKPGRKLTLRDDHILKRGKHQHKHGDLALRSRPAPVPTPVTVSKKDLTHRKHPTMDLRRGPEGRLGGWDDGDRDNKTATHDPRAADKKRWGVDDHVAIPMDDPRRRPRALRRGLGDVVSYPWGVCGPIVLSTATIHCIAFNVSPGLRRLFGLEAQPLGAALVLTWTLVGLATFLAGCLGDRVRDRLRLLRYAAGLWGIAVVVLQGAHVAQPLALAQGLAALGFVAAMLAHGALMANILPLLHRRRRPGGCDGPTPPPPPTLSDDAPRTRRYLRGASGAHVLASCGVQGLYFVFVNLDPDAAGPAPAPLLPSRRAFFGTLGLFVAVLCAAVAFLIRSRPSPEDAGSSAAAAAAAASPGSHSTLSPTALALERKLAKELETAVMLTPRDLGRLCRRVVVLNALVVCVLLTVTGVGCSLVGQLAAPGPRGLPPLQLSSFAAIFVGWLSTMLCAVGQLRPTKNLYVQARAMELPSQRIHGILVLVSLACAGAFAAFVRAQLYTTLFVQSCQMRLEVSAIAMDPNLLGAAVGLTGLAMTTLSARLVDPLVRGARKCLGGGDDDPSAATATVTAGIAPARRVSLGVLCYLIAIFLSGVVELYRRRRPTAPPPASSSPRGCHKVSSDLSVLWTLPHLVVLALADGLVRLGVAEEVEALTMTLGWGATAHGVVALADAIGFGAALALSSALAKWLYVVESSDLVLLFLLTTSLASLSYSLTKRLAERVEARPLRDSDIGEDDHYPQDLDTRGHESSGHRR